MPTYGYRCQSCDAEFDVVQRMTDPAEASCPSCSGAGRRLFYPVGITFKGQGFYKTDSRSTSTESTTAPAATKPESNGSSATSPAPPAAAPPAAAPSTPAPRTPTHPE